MRKLVLSIIILTITAIVLAQAFFSTPHPKKAKDIVSEIMPPNVPAADLIKKADLAGSWYPKSRTELFNLIKAFLNAANPEKPDGRILAVISPHAGYRFSGLIAAYGFKAVQDQAVKTVVIIGFSHRKIFDGISVYDKGAWATPLGDVRIDERLAQDLLQASPRIKFEPGIFKEENSVEVQVPFVQVLFPNAKIVPIAFGTQDYADAQALARSLAEALKNRNDVLIVASTDLSHYHAYEEANMIDKHLMNVLNTMKAKDLYDEAKLGICELCGVMPVTATLLTAQELGFNEMKILKYSNSGDTSGNKDNVVGYVSAVIYKTDADSKAIGQRQAEKKGEEKAMLNEIQRKRLLVIARESIVNFVREKKRKQFSENDTVLNKTMGVFVTLREAGELRGCKGDMIGEGPLYNAVAAIAIDSATNDWRFPPLTAKEIDMIDIEISVLSPLRRVSSYDEIQIPGDGVLVKKGINGGVYLPQVATETGWTREQFLTSLCAHKAGLAPDAWKDPATEIYIFSAEVFGEK